jgi:hypothetical protein
MLACPATIVYSRPAETDRPSTDARGADAGVRAAGRVAAAAGAALAMLAACGSPGAAPAGVTAVTPSVARARAVHPEDPAMIQHLRELIALLAGEVTLADLTGRLGPVDHDPGIPQPAELASRDPADRRVEIGRYPETGKPFTVEVELAAPVSVAALVAKLGAYRQARTDRGQPRQIYFPAAGAGPWHVVVLAELPAGNAPIEGGEATVLTLRRDPRS